MIKFIIFYQRQLLRQVVIYRGIKADGLVRIMSLLYLSFKKSKIPYVKSHLMWESLDPHVRVNVRIIIRWLRLPFPISLYFWAKCNLSAFSRTAISQFNFTKMLVVVLLTLHNWIFPEPFLENKNSVIWNAPFHYQFCRTYSKTTQ